MTLIRGLQTIGIGAIRGLTLLLYAVTVFGLTIGTVLGMVYLASWLPTFGAGVVGVAVAGGVVWITCLEDTEDFLLSGGLLLLMLATALLVTPTETYQAFWFRLACWGIGDGLLMVCAGVGLKYQEPEEEQPTPAWKLPPKTSDAKETV